MPNKVNKSLSDSKLASSFETTINVYRRELEKAQVEGMESFKKVNGYRMDD